MNFVRPAICSGTRDLQIISPYFVPRQPGTALLIGLVQRGVKVRVLTNSLAATDVIAVHGGYARWRQRLLSGGVELFELRPYATHKRDSLFGSSVASLHIHFARMAAGLPAPSIRLLPKRGLCPCCGSAPVAGLITASGQTPGARYL